MKTILQSTALKSVLIALVVAAYVIHGGAAFLHELSGEIRSDTTIYFAVGRGILNGLTPYIDLFDFRPPGMFLVGALSLMLSDGYLAAHWMQAMMVILIPLVAYFGFPERKWWGAAFGILLMLLTMTGAGNIQTESFGALFALLAIAMLRRSDRYGWVVAGISIAIAALFKEPFVFAILGAMLIVCPKKNVVLKTGLVTIITWLIVMVLLGTLRPYFEFYLPYTKALRASDTLLLEGLRIDKAILYYWQFSPVFLVLITLLVWFYAQLEAKKWMTAIVALYLMTLAVGASGDFYPQHQVFAVPVLLAFFVRSNLTQWVKIFLMIAPFTIALAPIEKTRAWEEEQMHAEKIDQIMDDCSYDRYLYIGGLGSSVPALTVHSPLGPGFFISDYTARTVPLVESMNANINNTDLVVFQKVTHVLGSEKKVYDLLQKEAVASFSVTPPSCASKNLESEEYVLLFRN